MANESVKYSIMGDPQSALAAQKAVIDQQDKTIEKLRQTGRESKQTGDKGKAAFGDMAGGLMKVAGLLGVGGGIAGALGNVGRLTEEWSQGLKLVVDRIQQAASESTALAMMQEGGKARGRVVQARALGAQYGQTGAAVLDLIQSLQAQTGTWAAGKAAAEEALALSEFAAVPLPAARTAVSVGIGAGLTPAMAARLPYAAGEASALSPAELVNIAPAMPFYQGAKGGPGQAYGFAAALSKTFTGELLPTYTRSLATALSAAPETKWGKYLSKLPGYEEGDFPAILQALKDRGIDTTKELAEVGLGEVRQQASIVALVRDMEETRAKLEQVNRLAAQPGLIESSRLAAEVNYPELRLARVSGRLAAELDAERALPTTEAGRRQEMAEWEDKITAQKRALAMQRAGYGPWVGEEGEVGRRMFARLLGIPVPFPSREAQKWGFARLKAVVTGQGAEELLEEPGAAGRLMIRGRGGDIPARRTLGGQVVPVEAMSQKAFYRRTGHVLPDGAAEVEPPLPPSIQTTPWWQNADVDTLLDRQRAWAGRPDRPQAMILTGQGEGGDQRAEQRHSELVHEVRRVADGLERMESGSATNPMPEAPAR